MRILAYLSGLLKYHNRRLLTFAEIRTMLRHNELRMHKIKHSHKLLQYPLRQTLTKLSSRTVVARAQRQQTTEADVVVVGAGEDDMFLPKLAHTCMHAYILWQVSIT